MPSGRGEPSQEGGDVTERYYEIGSVFVELIEDFEAGQKGAERGREGEDLVGSDEVLVEFEYCV